MQSLRHKACLAGSSPCGRGQGVRQALAPASCILVGHGFSRSAGSGAGAAGAAGSGKSSWWNKGRAAPSAGSGTSKSNMWESARIVCDDGDVLASLEMLAMSSPVLRGHIDTALQRLAPNPIEDEEDEDGCFSVAQPVDLKMPGMTTEEWKMLLQQLYLEVPRTQLDLDALYKLLPLAHKMGMSKLVGYLETSLQAQLPAALSMDPTSPGYMIKWLVLADQLQLTQTKDICVGSIRHHKYVSGSTGRKPLSRDDLQGVKQLSHGTMVDVLMAATSCHVGPN